MTLKRSLLFGIESLDEYQFKFNVVFSFLIGNLFDIYWLVKIKKLMCIMAYSLGGGGGRLECARRRREKEKINL